MHVIEAMTGGARRFVLDAAAGLAERGFAQHVVLSLRRDRYGQADVELLRGLGIEVTVVDMVRAIHPLHDLHDFLTIRGLIEDWRPDIVHGHSSKAGFLARAAVRFSRLSPRPRVVYSPHCFAFSARTDPLRRSLYASLERLAARWTDHFAFVSPGEAVAAREVGIRIAGRSSVIPLAVDADHFSGQTEMTRQALGLPDGLLFIAVGALRPQKNHSLLLGALSLIARKVDAQLAIVGDGPLRPRIEAQARRLGVADRVVFLGHRDDVPDLLAVADCFVLGSLWEGLPYSLLEAMVSRLPVVVPDLPGMADIVAASGGGIIYQPGSATALSAAMIAVAAASESERGRWGENGCKWVLARHTPHAFINALTSMYEGLVAGNSPGGR